MRVEFHLSLSELTALERCEKSAERARRMRIVILAMSGWTAPAVAMATDLSRRVCQWNAPDFCTRAYESWGWVRGWVCAAVVACWSEGSAAD